MDFCNKCKIGVKFEIQDNLVCPGCENSKFLSLVNQVLSNTGQEIEMESGFSREEIVESFENLVHLSYTNKLYNYQKIEKCADIALQFRSIHLYDELKTMQDKVQSFDYERYVTEREDHYNNLSVLLSRNYDNLEDFLNLIDIIKQQTKFSSEQIGIELKGIKKEYPLLSDLQALYYVSCRFNVYFFEDWQRIAHAKFDGICIECSQKIFKDDNIFWNPKSKKVKHFDCKTAIQSLDKSFKLHESANEKFVSSDYDGGMKIMDEIRLIKFGSVFEHDELASKVETIFENSEKFKEVLNEIKTSELPVLANSLNFSKFKKEYETKFIEICNSKISSDVTNDFKILLRNNPEKSKIFTNLIREEYEKFNSRVSYFLNNIRNNVSIFQNIVNKSGKKAFFVDPYMGSREIRYFYSHFPSKVELRELRILTSLKPFNEIKWFESFFGSVKELKKYFDDAQIKLEVKVLCGEKINDFHNRYFYGDELFLEIPDGMDKLHLGSYNGKISRADPDLRDDERNNIEKIYMRESCYDLFEHYQEIKSEVDKNIKNNQRKKF